MKMKIIMAIDVGASGGIAWTEIGSGVRAMSFKNRDEQALIAMLRTVVDDRKVVAYVEKVGGFVKPRPNKNGEFRLEGMGFAMFNFGEKAGFIRGALLALGAEVVMVPPATWQQSMFLGKRGGLNRHQWKTKLKDRAQRRFPGINVTLETADALLILAYALLAEPNRQQDFIVKSECLGRIPSLKPSDSLKPPARKRPAPLKK
jgi:hypothetical protein